MTNKTIEISEQIRQQEIVVNTASINLQDRVHLLTSATSAATLARTAHRDFVDMSTTVMAKADWTAATREDLFKLLQATEATLSWVITLHVEATNVLTTEKKQLAILKDQASR